MLVFIVPLKSSKASKSWEHVSKWFERCIRSICNQTSSDFKVIVVCHEKPVIEFNHPSIIYVEVDFPRPDHTFGSRTWDRDSKVVTGLIVARKLKPSHTMEVDADDCVSKHLAEFVRKHSHCNGWFVDKGYEYLDGSTYIRPFKKLYRVCGSSNIIKYDLHNLPESTDFDSPFKYHISHNKLIETMARRGTPIEPLPFVGTVYIINVSKENDSLQPSFSEKLHGNPRRLLSPVKRSVLKVFTSQPLTPSIQEEFGLYRIDS